MTVRTACSSALVGLHEACLAIQQGHCKSAVVGGANLIMAPGATASMTEKGVLSPDGSCKTLSADANGYARGEAITAIYIKPLEAARRDGNPIRAVIRSAMSNNDGKTPGVSCPSTESQVAMIRDTYREAGITDFAQTAFVECHGTGTAVGDPIEANAVAQVFGDSGVFIGSVKPNLGHSEGASGITSVIKAVLALENRTIPPNIKFSSPNPAIPFRERRLVVPLEPTPWPESRGERVSVNSFGIGGSNAHVVLDSARGFHGPLPPDGPEEQDCKLVAASSRPHLLLLSAASATSLERMSLDLQAWLADNDGEQLQLQHVAYTLAHRREHLQHRAFMVARREQPGVVCPGRKASSGARPPNLVMVFSGQGAQWARMGRELLLRSDLCFQSSIRSLDRCLREAKLPNCSWSLEEELLKPARTSRVQEAEFSQPLCTAVQVALVDLFASVGVEPVAVVGTFVALFLDVFNAPVSFPRRDGRFFFDMILRLLRSFQRRNSRCIRCRCSHGQGSHHHGVAARAGRHVSDKARCHGCCEPGLGPDKGFPAHFGPPWCCRGMRELFSECNPLGGRCRGRSSRLPDQAGAS